MTHQPPVPAAATSPFPLHPAPHNDVPRIDKVVTRGVAAAKSAVPDGRSLLGLGAAIGIGSAAIVAALLFARRKDVPTAHKASGDDKSKRGKPDRARVAGGEPYEVTYFARKHRISAAEARRIIKQAGPDRAAANALAKRSAKG